MYPTVEETGRLDEFECLQGFITEEDLAKIEQRQVDFTGPGVYSLDDEGVYRKGKFATFSRIALA